MSWGLLDDGFFSHPKVIRVRSKGLRGRAAIGLWALANAYCSRHTDDGTLSHEACKSLGGTPREAQMLVEAGLWATCDEGYRFHDWDDYRKESKALESRRKKDRERQSRRRSRDSHVTVSRDCHVTSRVRNTQPNPTQPSTPQTPPPETHTPLSPELDERIAIAIGEFGRRYESARGMPWMGHSRAHRALAGLVAWADAMGGRSGRGWRQEACQALDGYFKDSWAQEKDFPVSALSGAPGKYHTPPKEPADSVRRIERGPPRDVMREALEFSKEGTVPQTLRVPGKVRGA